MPDDAKQPMTPERLDEFCRLLGEYAQDNKKKDIHKFITNSEPFTIKINGKEKTINANHDFSVSTLGGDVGDQYVNGILKFFRENSNSAPDMLFTSIEIGAFKLSEDKRIKLADAIKVKEKKKDPITQDGLDGFFEKLSLEEPDFHDISRFIEGHAPFGIKINGDDKKVITVNSAEDMLGKDSDSVVRTYYLGEFLLKIADMAGDNSDALQSIEVAGVKLSEEKTNELKGALKRVWDEREGEQKAEQEAKKKKEGNEGDNKQEEDYGNSFLVDSLRYFDMVRQEIMSLKSKDLEQSPGKNQFCEALIRSKLPKPYQKITFNIDGEFITIEKANDQKGIKDLVGRFCSFNVPKTFSASIVDESGERSLEFNEEGKKQLALQVKEWKEQSGSIDLTQSLADDILSQLIKYRNARLALNPKKQKRIREELQSIFGCLLGNYDQIYFDFYATEKSTGNQKGDQVTAEKSQFNISNQDTFFRKLFNKLNNGVDDFARKNGGLTSFRVQAKKGEDIKVFTSDGKLVDQYNAALKKAVNKGLPSFKTPSPKKIKIPKGKKSKKGSDSPAKKLSFGGAGAGSSASSSSGSSASSSSGSRTGASSGSKRKNSSSDTQTPEDPPRKKPNNRVFRPYPANHFFADPHNDIGFTESLQRYAQRINQERKGQAQPNGYGGIGVLYNPVFSKYGNQMVVAWRITRVFDSGIANKAGIQVGDIFKFKEP